VLAISTSTFNLESRFAHPFGANLRY
jgi:hypothetical protein